MNLEFVIRPDVAAFQMLAKTIEIGEHRCGRHTEGAPIFAQFGEALGTILSASVKFALEKIGKLLGAQNISSIRRLQPSPVVAIQDGRADGGATVIVAAQIAVAEGHVRRHQISIGRFCKSLLNLCPLLLAVRAACIFVDPIKKLSIRPFWGSRSVHPRSKFLGESRKRASANPSRGNGSGDIAKPFVVFSGREDLFGVDLGIVPQAVRDRHADIRRAQ